MTKMTIMKTHRDEKMRDLICFAIQQVLDNGYLDSIGDNGAVKTSLLGKNSIISWRDVGYRELYFIVFWGYKGNESPENVRIHFAYPHKLRQYVDVCCGGVLERQTGLWVQGTGKNGLDNMYCSNVAKDSLMSIPTFESKTLKRTGKIII